jgi:hypothetical protein
MGLALYVASTQLMGYLRHPDGLTGRSDTGLMLAGSSDSAGRLQAGIALSLLPQRTKLPGPDVSSRLRCSIEVRTGFPLP